MLTELDIATNEFTPSSGKYALPAEEKYEVANLEIAIGSHGGTQSLLFEAKFSRLPNGTPHQTKSEYSMAPPEEKKRNIAEVFRGWLEEDSEYNERVLELLETELPNERFDLDE